LNLGGNECCSFTFFIPHKLTEKKTKDNQIGKEGGKAFADFLKVNSSIQHLNLGGNEFF
jgi:hypothetical protein